MPQKDAADLPLAALYAAGFVGYPFVSVLPMVLGTDSRSISVLFRAVVVALSAFLIVRWFARGRLVLAGWPLRCFAILWALLLARLCWDWLLAPLPLNMEWTDMFSFAIGVTLLPAIAMLEIPTLKTLRLALWLSHLVGAMALLGVTTAGVQAILSGRLLARLATDNLNPTSLGNLAVTVFITSVATSELLKGVAGFGARLVRLASLALSVGAALATLASVSKGPIICLFIVAFILAAAPIVGRASVARITVRISVVLIGLGLAVWSAFLIEENTPLMTVSRFTETADDSSTQDRAIMLRGALEQFAAHPWVGDSTVERISHTYPHNVFLEAGMATGILGLVALLAFALASWRSAWLTLRQGWCSAWLALMFVEYFIASLLSGSLYLSAPFWATAIAVNVAALLRTSVARCALPAAS